ncbi:leucine-rich repeat-containing protein 63 [Narcine bancroftii]|uniref:leucine-rich repeat-containing protein 63 n=1 Tax=Narcine bancroftii TaxID=1343680 RepID=UPI0038315048
MSKYPQLLRRPLPPKDAFPFENVSTENASGSAPAPEKENVSINEPEIKDLSVTCAPSGLNGFPSRGIIVQRPDYPYFAEDDIQYCIPATCTLDTFHQKHYVNILPDERKIILSRHNFNKIIKVLESQLMKHNQKKVNIVELSMNGIPPVLKRIPQRQQILEMIAVARNQADGLKYGISTELSNSPGTSLNIEECTQFLESESPIKEELQGKHMSSYEFVIARSISIGGESLNLRGYFIHQLPNLTFLVSTLKYLNLSFNSFRVIPTEIYQFSCLEMLNLRDNPITEISPDIEKLTNMRIFNISFCIISILPVGLFLLPHLQSLNVAYNKISNIPRDIRNLRELKFLNVEGNELSSLPCGLLELPLKHIRIHNNYMHHLFWEESMPNQPQHLIDLAAFSFTKNNLQQHYINIPEAVQRILNNASVCDSCKGPLFGSGLRWIRPRKTIFNIKSLPFLFCACSPSCFQSLKSKTH